MRAGLKGLGASAVGGCVPVCKGLDYVCNLVWAVDGAVATTICDEHICNVLQDSPAVAAANTKGFGLHMGLRHQAGAATAVNYGAE